MIARLASIDEPTEALTTLTNSRPYFDDSTIIPPPATRASFVVVSGPARGQTFRIEGLMVIGRDESAQIKIECPTMSRSHASITRTPEGAFIIRDLGSRNGTTVNGIPRAETVLKFGDRVGFGPSTNVVFTPIDDVSERMREAQRLESLGALAGAIGHDFNNLLSVVTANLEFLLEGLPHAALRISGVRPAIEDSLIAARRGADLTKQLKTLARCGQWSNAEIDVPRLTREVAMLLRPVCDPRIEIQLELEDDVGTMGDPIQLHQVLMNMSMNARDAMPDGGVLLFKLRRVTDGLELSVQDTGTGMDPRTASRVFEPFFTTKPLGAGTGLGMATAYGIVKRMGGEIGLDTELGKGTTFRVTLPAT
jgi:signal transduction histidine kinase